MSHWKITLLAACLIASCATKTANLVMDDGHASAIRLGGISANFDGVDRFTITTLGRIHSISAKTPATLSIADNHQFAIHNYGHGSGQVYSLSVIDLTSGRSAQDDSVRRAIAAKAIGCQAKPDHISLVFQKWIGVRRFEIAVEDFNRDQACKYSRYDYEVAIKNNGQDIMMEMR